MSATNADVYMTEDVTLAHLLYGLMSAFPLFFMPVIVSFWLNISQKYVLADTLLASHLHWQKQSMLGFVPIMALGYLVGPLWLSMAVYSLGISWFCYRIFKGWLSLHDGVNP